MTRVLIADDDEEIRVTLRFLLEDEGYIVEEAPNGATALDAMRASRVPLVVLLDNLMPVMDGASLLNAVKEDKSLKRRHAFILITASPRRISQRLSNLLSGLAVPVVPKPFELDTVLDAVARATRHLPTDL
jgi:CheY-like chemotaxis protein